MPVGVLALGPASPPKRRLTSVKVAVAAVTLHLVP